MVYDRPFFRPFIFWGMRISLPQIAAIFEQASETAGEGGGGPLTAPSWRSFDMRAVVSATEDLLLFILSEKGRRVRIFLIRDIIQAVDALLQEEKSHSEVSSISQNGFPSLTPIF